MMARASKSATIMSWAVPMRSEEASERGGAAPPVGSRFFLVDPLGGTKEFINGRDEFTVNIAFVEVRQPVFGLVYAPARRLRYMTLSRTRAVMAQVADDASDWSLAALQLRPIRVRDAQATDPFVVCASRSHRSAKLESYLERFPDAESLAVGSSLKFCIVAEGRADPFPRLGPKKEWDTAASHAVVLAAGGNVTREDGTPLDYGKTSHDLLNPDFLVFGPRFSL